MISPDGRHVLVGRVNIHQPALLNARNGEPSVTLENVGLVVLQPDSSSFSADGTLLKMTGQRAVERVRPKGGVGSAPPEYTGGGHFLTIWDVATGKSIKSWDKDVKSGF